MARAILLLASVSVILDLQVYHVVKDFVQTTALDMAFVILIPVNVRATNSSQMSSGAV